MKKMTRRDFVENTLSSSLGFILAGSNNLWAANQTPADSANPHPASKMRFGLVTYTWAADWDLNTLITNCEKAGIFGVELRTQHAHGVDPGISADRCKEVKKRFADSTVALIGLGCNACFDSPDPEKLKQNIADAKAYLKLSHDVGGTGVKVKPNDFHDGVPHETTLAQIAKSLNELGPFAADLNQQLRLEVHGTCCHLPDIKAIMDQVTHPAVRICWNSNNDDLAGQGLEYNFNLVKKYFGDTVHVRELNIGDYPYPKLISLFAKADYKGWILLEARTKPEDRLAALIEQRKVFDDLLAKAKN